MASVSKEKNGNRRILFIAPEGSRKTIRLGKVSQRDAESIARHVEALLVSKTANQPIPQQTATWLASVGETLYKRLAAVGLVANREGIPTATLGEFLIAYIDGRTDLKPLTIYHLNDARRSLIAFFGDDKPLESITPGDADEFRRHLAETLGDNTVRRKCGRAKQFFRAALRKRFIQENPFADMKACSVQANRARDYFLSRDDAERILEACPDAQWRLLFALSRFGGLRCPSEHLALTWSDINWAESKLLVHSPKTEHHEGKATRVVPIFPELKPHLEAVWEQAEPGTQHVITRYRDATQNLRTTFTKIIGRAGLTPWPKLFQNLRASRATELAAEHPAHVAAAWLGHSTIVANKHYWQVTDADFAKATANVETGDAKAAQKAAQQMHEMGCRDSQAPMTAHEETPVLPGFAASCEYLPNCQAPFTIAPSSRTLKCLCLWDRAQSLTLVEAPSIPGESRTPTLSFLAITETSPASVGR